MPQAGIYNENDQWEDEQPAIPKQTEPSTGSEEDEKDKLIDKLTKRIKELESQLEDIYRDI